QDQIHRPEEGLGIIHASVARYADWRGVIRAPLLKAIARLLYQLQKVLGDIGSEVPVLAGQIPLVGDIDDYVPKLLLDEPLSDVPRRPMDRFRRFELLVLPLIEVHDIDDHAALVGRHEQSLEPPHPIVLEGSIRAERAHGSAFSPAVTI